MEHLLLRFFDVFDGAPTGHISAFKNVTLLRASSILLMADRSVTRVHRVILNAWKDAPFVSMLLIIGFP